MTVVAHVAGVPLEEALPTITPVALLLAALARTRLRAIRARHVRRSTR